MFGTIRVVKDVSEIPLDQDAPASDSPVVALRPFIRKWQVADLAGSLDQFDAHRSPATGKKLFQALACAACHQLRGEGGKVGPDLTEVNKKLASKKMDRLGLVTELIQPSKVIDEQFRTQVIVTDDGKLISGVILFEDEKIVRVVSNPLDKEAKPVEIQKSAIEERTPSNVSIMPEGLLNTLTRDEIFDLLTFIVSGGDTSHDHHEHK
jgi:putative heme-binding domain-containing protein